MRKRTLFVLFLLQNPLITVPQEVFEEGVDLIVGFRGWRVILAIGHAHPKAIAQRTVQFDRRAQRFPSLDWIFRTAGHKKRARRHEYMEFVRDNARLESAPFRSVFEKDYGTFSSQADLFRQIGLDERHHKEESLSRMAQPRFSAPRSSVIISK